MKGASQLDGAALATFARLVGLVGLLALAGPNAASAQCSLCRDAVEDASPQTRAAMNAAIIGLALTPYAVVALAAWVLSPALRVRFREEAGRLRGRLKGTPS